jgi:hypothetical protein
MKRTLILTLIAALLLPAAPANASGRSDWSGLYKLAAGTKVIVIAAGKEFPSRFMVAVDEAGVTVLSVEGLVEKFARTEISEIRAYPDRAGTFMGDFGGLFAIGGALAGLIRGGMLGHRQFARHKGLGAFLGALGGYVVGLAAGIATMAIGGAFREDVIYRSPT